MANPVKFDPFKKIKRKIKDQDKTTKDKGKGIPIPGKPPSGDKPSISIRKPGKPHPGTAIKPEEEPTKFEPKPTIPDTPFKFDPLKSIKETIRTPESYAITEEERTISKTMQTAPTVYTSEGKREWAIKQLIDKGRLPYGYSAVRPRTGGIIKTSPFKEDFGYIPDDPDYSLIYSDIEKQVFEAKDLQRNLISNITTAEQTLPGLQEALEKIRNAPSGTKFFIDTNLDGTPEKYSRKRAEEIFLKAIEQNETLLEKRGVLVNLQKYINKLEAQKDMITTYESQGYEVEQIGDEYSFSLPSAEKVHDVVIGDGLRSSVMKGATAFFESPLGIRTGVDILSQNVMMSPFFGRSVTAMPGQYGVPDFTSERLSRYSLQLYKTTTREGLPGFAKELAISPAMVEGVYIPALTLGTGYFITGISEGASSLSAVTKSSLARFGTTLPGKVTSYGSRIGLGIVGTTGIIKTGETLISGLKQPRALPGLIAQTGFTFGMAYGGYRTGQRLYRETHMGSWKYNWAKGKVEWVREEPQVIRGVSDVLEFREGDISKFTTESIMDVSGKKATARLFGVGKRTPKGEIEATGTGRFTWYYKSNVFGEQKITRFFDFFAKGKKVDITNIRKDFSFFESKAQSELLAGKPGAYGYGAYKPTYSKGVSIVKDLGRLKPGEFEILPRRLVFRTETGFKEFPLPKQSRFMYGGEFRGQAFGKQLQFGRTLTFDMPGGKPSVSIGGSNLTLDYGTLFKGLGEKITPVLEKPTKPFIKSTPGVLGAGAKSTTVLDVETQDTLVGDTTTVTTVKPVVKGWGDLNLFTGAIPKGVQTEWDKMRRGVKRRVVSTGKTVQEISEAEETGLYVEPGKPVIEREEPDVGFGLGWWTGLVSKPGQRQILGLKQKQLLETMQQKELISVTQFGDLELFPPTEHAPPFALPGEEEKAKRIKRIKKRKGKGFSDTDRFDKGLLSDIVSVTQSQARYGIATHPKATKELWELGKKRMFVRVPTKEMLKAKNRKKSKMLSKWRKKDVLI